MATGRIQICLSMNLASLKEHQVLLFLKSCILLLIKSKKKWSLVAVNMHGPCCRRDTRCDSTHMIISTATAHN